jgi:hypothetical protein
MVLLLVVRSCQLDCTALLNRLAPWPGRCPAIAVAPASAFTSRHPMLRLLGVVMVGVQSLCVVVVAWCR